MNVRLETKSLGEGAEELNGADLETLAKAFQGYHGEATKITAAVEKLNKRFDDMEAKQNRLGLGGGGSSANARQAEHKAAFALFAKTGDPNALNVDTKATAGIAANDPAGGFLVPEEVSREILAYQLVQSPLRRLARVVTTGSASYKQVFSRHGVTAGWVGETQSRPQTDSPDLSEIDVPASEVYAMPAVSQQLLDDAFIDVAAFIEQEISSCFDQKESAAFISGDGVLQPRGLLTYPIVATVDASRAFGTFEYIATGVSGDFAASNRGDVLVDLVYRVTAPYRTNASWLKNSATLAVISKMKDGQGNYLWRPGFTADQPATILGYPVVASEDMPDIGASTYSVAFGDFKRGYLITDRIGIRILRDPYSSKPYVLFYATKRVGGTALDTRAIKFLKFAAS